MAQGLPESQGTLRGRRYLLKPSEAGSCGKAPQPWLQVLGSQGPGGKSLSKGPKQTVVRAGAQVGLG